MPESQLCPRCSSPVPAGSRYCQKCGGAVAPRIAKKAVQTRSGGSSQVKTFLIGALALLLVIAAAMTGIQFTRRSGNTAQAPQPAPHEIHGAGPMPGWLAMADPSIVADYTWAADHHDELQFIPCYCGCGAQGHHSNSACYFKRDEATAAIQEYDPHAYG